MTDEEKHLWYDFLKKLPFTVKRIVIELDGSQHLSEENEISDKKRDAELNKLGLRVIRYTNDDIKKHFYEVCTELSDVFGINTQNIEIEA